MDERVPSMGVDRQVNVFDAARGWLSSTKVRFDSSSFLNWERASSSSVRSQIVHSSLEGIHESVKEMGPLFSATEVLSLGDVFESRHPLHFCPPGEAWVMGALSRLLRHANTNKTRLQFGRLPGSGGGGGDDSSNFGGSVSCKRWEVPSCLFGCGATPSVAA